MHVIVLGSGVVGTATAYYLARQGASVTVLERQPGAGLETSFANAGEISPTFSSPWADPSVPGQALQWLLDRNGPLRVYPQLDWYQWRWLWQMLKNCRQDAYDRNKRRMLTLAMYSREQFVAFRAQGITLDYDGQQRGTLLPFLQPQDAAKAQRDADVLAQYQLPFRMLQRDEVLAIEPGLQHSSSPLLGGMHLPLDETGDCFKFTTELAAMARTLGVDFRFGVQIRRLLSDGKQITAIDTDQGMLHGDAYVLALGSYSPLLTRPLGIDLPVYPVKGYSLTVPVADAAAAPQSTLLDGRYRTGITRLGNRIRAAGTAELSGYNQTLRPGRLATLRQSVQSLFPHGGDYRAIEYWSGLRPMTPDSTPLVGPTRYPNLWLNTGHGTLGWTMSLGTGKLVADWVCGGTPEIATDGLTLARYTR
ncbi:D-amino acid dehydrogenase [Vogesella sp. AC12]|uniref:D-amino acid dehydrogenase n=1 Tax=Vogesella sp. AC12 TaxID=2950550 RepID=UPI00210D516A|nr:D-amino acid dehydrogenase [Vogesella sp. AC12]MCQ4143384.1 D-amino acid dehydrogenase [Vogesella sp. AC12]